MLNAQDVHDKQFKLVRQSTGYDIDEVDTFLDEVEAAIAALTAELAEARAAGGATAAEADPGAGAAQAAVETHVVPADDGEPPTSAARILELAQLTADQYLAEAKRAADSLRADAEQSARAAVADLEGQRVDLEGQRADLEARVAALRSFEAQVRSRLTDYFEGQLRDLRSLGAPPDSGATA